MASSKDLKIINQAQKEYAIAKKKGDTLGMKAAHLKADKARGATTTTKVDARGNYYQSIVSAAPPTQKSVLPTPSQFRNASAETRISKEQQDKNQATALKELQGKNGKAASFARGAALSILDPLGLRKLTKSGTNSAQDQASNKNTYSTQFVKNPRAVAMGLQPMKTVKGKGTYEGLGEMAGSMIGVDPVGIGITKGIQKGVQIAKGLKAVEKIPVVTEKGKIRFEAPAVTKAETIPTKTTKAVKPTLAKDTTPKKESIPIVPKKETVAAEIPAQAQNKAVPPRNVTAKTLPKQFDVSTLQFKSLQKKPSTIPLNNVVQRIDKGTANLDKPQGLYTTPAEFVSPHKDVGNKMQYFEISKNANVYDVKYNGKLNTNRGSNMEVGSTVNYLVDKLGKDQVEDLFRLSKQDLVKMFSAKYSDVDWNRYYDKQDILEGYGGLLAKENGIDVIRSYNKKDPFSETIILNKNSTKEIPNPFKPIKPLSKPQNKAVPPLITEKGTTAQPKQIPLKNGEIKQPQFNSVGVVASNGEKTTTQLINEYGAIPKGEAPRAREIDVPKKTDYGQTQQYARTLQESSIVDDNLFKEIDKAITEGSFTKPTKSNRIAVEDASRTIENDGVDNALSRFKSVITAEKKPTSYDIALGNRVLQELQKSGRYDDAVNVAIDLSEILSESGRTLQAARIVKRLSPEGRLTIAARTAKKVAEKTGQDINLSDETIKLISDAKTEKEITDANNKAALEIWNQTPASWTDKVNSWRYMSMLFNPKTHIRNIVGNALFLPVREFKNLIGTGLERAIIRDGEKTKAILNPLKDKSIMEFASKDFDNVKPTLKNEGKLDPNVRPIDAKVFNNGLLEGLRKISGGALDAEDTWFIKFAYDSSLAQYMKANKLTAEDMVGDTLEKARSYAMNEALKATYRDFNALANIISRGKANLSGGQYGLLGKTGGVALEGLVPFTKTPLNIVKRGVAYSPANIMRGIANLARVKTGKVTATEAIDQLASGLSGSALLALGTYLGYNNIVKGKEGDYKDKLYNYNQMLGSQNYSLNVDGKSYTLDWAAPLSMPFFVGVEISNAIKDSNADLASVLDAMTQISDPMVNLSMLKGINDIITNNFEGLGQTALDVATGYAGQYVPTLFGQIARTADNTRRSTISTNETGLVRDLEKFGRKQLSKIPIASKKLEPYVDLWGREQRSGSAIENFLSPGYLKKENVTPVDKELQSLIGKLDEETAKKIIPTSTAYQYSLDISSEKYPLTERQSTDYQKTRGQESFAGLSKLFSSEGYKKMSEEDKAKAIEDVYSAANKKAKIQYLKSVGKPAILAMAGSQQETYAKVKAFGVSEDQYINSYDATKGVKGVPDKSGKHKFIPLSESFNKKLAIDKANPNATPAQLKALYYAFNVSEKVW